MNVRGAAVGFFDEDFKEGISGCGMVLKINDFHVFNLCMGGDQGSNTKAELLDLWGILYFAN